MPVEAGQRRPEVGRVAVRVVASWVAAERAPEVLVMEAVAANQHRVAVVWVAERWEAAATAMAIMAVVVAVARALPRLTATCPRRDRARRSRASVRLCEVERPSSACVHRPRRAWDRQEQPCSAY